MNKLKKGIILTITASILTFFGLSFVPMASTYAATTTDICKQDGVPEEVLKANGCKGAGKPAEIKAVVVNILNPIIGSLGLVAVVFVVVGGINYMTSAGDAAKTQKAKNTILYALIGLVVCALAFAIVNFVIGKINAAA